MVNGKTQVRKIMRDSVARKSQSDRICNTGFCYGHQVITPQQLSYFSSMPAQELDYYRCGAKLEIEYL